MIANTATLLFGIQGQTLAAEEKRWLQHPLTAGVILFTRNYQSPDQIRQLIKTIRQTATNEILIAVDHEGGRVQRFRQGFTVIPPMAALGRYYDRDKPAALAFAKDCGYVLAHEIAACDIDFSFAPVLDVQSDCSTVIGDRAFHADVDSIGDLATAFCQGMGEAGLVAVGKHFPGHGHASADSHLELPVVEDDFKTLEKRDLPPFIQLIKNGLAAIMPAHILYSQVDGMPAGFSAYWLQTLLREKWGFDGCIISDDLDMAGAAAFGSMADRIDLASRHCDLILLCNNCDDMRAAFTYMTARADATRQARLTALKRNPACHDVKRYEAVLQRYRLTADLLS